MAEISEEKHKLLNHYFLFYTSTTEKRFRDKVSTYNLNSDIQIIKTKRININESDIDVRFNLDVKSVNTYNCDVYFSIFPNTKIELKKRNCSCPYALSGKICEHITASLSYIFERIKKDDEIFTLFLRNIETKLKPQSLDFNALLHTMTKKQLINFIYSLEEDEELFKKVELKLHSFYSEES